MSTWRIAVRTLHTLGGKATVREVDAAVLIGEDSARAGLTVAADLGLVIRPGYGHQRKVMQPFQITQLGIDYCENRITQIEERPGGRRWVATWLSALPRGLRLAQCPSGEGQ